MPQISHHPFIFHGTYPLQIMGEAGVIPSWEVHSGNVGGWPNMNVFGLWEETGVPIWTPTQEGLPVILGIYPRTFLLSAYYCWINTQYTIWATKMVVVSSFPIWYIFWCVHTYQSVYLMQVKAKFILLNCLLFALAYCTWEGCVGF